MTKQNTPPDIVLARALLALAQAWLLQYPDAEDADLGVGISQFLAVLCEMDERFMSGLKSTVAALPAPPGMLAYISQNNHEDLHE